MLSKLPTAFAAGCLSSAVPDSTTISATALTVRGSIAPMDGTIFLAPPKARKYVGSGVVSGTHTHAKGDGW